MAIETIMVPDIGGAENVDVIEICVKAGDSIEVDDALLVLESDKASMDIPSPKAGVVKKWLVKEGDKVSEGVAVAEIETESEANAAVEPPTAQSQAAGAASGGSQETVRVPDIGGSENVDVIEVSVKTGDDIDEGDTICVLESDKASMDIPSPASGKVKSVVLKEGDKVSEGADVLVLEVAGSAVEAAPAAKAQTSAAPSTQSKVIDLFVPDIGGSDNVDVIEVAVKPGDEVSEGDTLLTLESDKASMDIPVEASGKIVSISAKEGDKLAKGDAIGSLEVSGDEVTEPQATTPKSTPATSSSAGTASASQVMAKPSSDVYAGPSVRKLSRQLGVDLAEVAATGPRGRVIREDVKAFVKQVMTQRAAGGTGTNGSGAGGSGIPAIPAVDFSKFGEIELEKMSKIKKVTAANMVRNWLNVPHVTQFDDVDITEMEAFRKGMKPDAEKAGVKLTPVPFLLKAVAAALKAEPSFNVSLHEDGEHLVHKKYINIGMAVDTPNGLMVPVIKDVDKKGLFELSAEAVELAKKARDGKLLPKDMQGGCFTISSLGAIGGTGFTPIVNAPEVAILGVSKAQIKPLWNGKDFEPRLMLPLSLSYDHRALNGADAGKFFTYLNTVLSEVRRLLL